MMGRVVVMIVVLLLHALLLAAAWVTNVARPRDTAPVLQVALIESPSRLPDRSPPPAEIALPRLDVPVPVLLVDDLAPTPVSVPPDQPAQASATTAPVAPTVTALSTELEVQCPDRKPPRYPRESRHLREQGEVLLRVELDETGGIERVSVVQSSGFSRLDEAARLAVGTWHCEPARLAGRPVPAVALQRLEFRLERR